MMGKGAGKVALPVLLAGLAGVLLFIPGGHARPDRSAHYAPGQVLVKYVEGTSSRARQMERDGLGARLLRRFHRHGIEHLELPRHMDVEKAVEKLSRNPLVQFAEPNWRVEPLATVIPNDPLFPQQWHLDSAFGDTVFLYVAQVPGPAGTLFNRVTFSVGDTLSIGSRVYEVDVDMDAPEAWAILDSAHSGTTMVSIGVIDSGLSETGFFDPVTGYVPDHEDLAGTLLSVNALEKGGIAGSDDDSNGYIDDVNGWDWYTSDDSHLPGSEPDDEIPGEDPVPSDSFGQSLQQFPDPTDRWHGTLISGIFASVWDNGIGGASMGQNRLKVLPLRTYIRADGIADLLTAIDYAAVLASNGGDVRVLNASWRLTGTSPSLSLKQSIQFAAGKGILFVTAAGNNRGNNDLRPVYPASFSVDPDLEGFVLAVGATSYKGGKAAFSNYGEDHVQIAAPGDNILSTYDGIDGYDLVSGTSFSTPVAAALAGLLAGLHPSLATTGIIDRIVEGGDFDDRLAGLFRDGKRINMYGALAPFHPFSALAHMDTLSSVSMYSDQISTRYGSISSAVSEDPSVAVMKPGPLGAWAVSPRSPGITTFSLNFDGFSAPVGSYGTGPWRVTCIEPFRHTSLTGGQTLQFTTRGTIPPGLVSWQVEDPAVGSVSIGGVFTASKAGTTRVVLLIDGVPYDTSAPIQVVTSTGGGGGCGTTLPPGDDPWSGLLELMSGIALLIGLRRMYLAEAGSTFNVPRSKQVHPSPQPPT